MTTGRINQVTTHQRTAPRTHALLGRGTAARAPRRRSPVPPGGQGSRLSLKTKQSTSPRDACKSSATSRTATGGIKTPPGTRHVRRPPHTQGGPAYREASLPRARETVQLLLSPAQATPALPPRPSQPTTPQRSLLESSEGRGEGPAGRRQVAAKALQRTSRAVPQPHQKPATPRQNDRRTIVWQGSTQDSASSQ